MRLGYAFLLISGIVGTARGAEWQFLGPEAAEITGMSDPSREAFVVSTAPGHVFRSDDGGKTWESVTVDLPAGADVSFGPVINDARNSQEFFVSSGFRSLEDQPRGNLHRSVDGGRTWKEADAGLGGGYPFALASGIDGEGGTDLYATVSLCPDSPSPCFSENFLSRDQGARWSELTNAPANGFVLAATPDSVYMAVDQRLFRSVDRGGSWQEIDDGIGSCSLTALAVDARNPLILYAAAAEEAGRFGCGSVFRSTDGGAHWADTGLTRDVRSLAARSTQVVAGARAPGFFYPPGGVTESLDGGASWIDLDAPTSNVSRVGLGLRGLSVYAASEQGLFELSLVTLPSNRIESPARVLPRSVTPP